MKTIYLLFFTISTITSMSLLDAYRSEKLTRRRVGMQNNDFRPILHLRGEDDWRKEISDRLSTNQFMDENGVVYDMDQTINERVASFFNKPQRRFG